MPLRVLLITPVFYGIEKKIKSVLEESDYEVIWFENKTLPLDYHGTNSKFQFLRRIYFLLFFPHVRYIKKELKKIENIRFDILFSINAHIICPYLFRKLKSRNPALFSVLYLWDAFSMYTWKAEIKNFNKVYTFDPVDSEKYRIGYKPNFHIRNHITGTHNQEFDLFFAGKFNPCRFYVVDKIVSQTDEFLIRYFLKLWPTYKNYLHNHLIYILLRIINFNSKWTKNYLLNYEAVEGILKSKFIMANSLTYEEIQDNLLCSNVVLDLPFQGQSGYSHRLIEALANGKKIITTNSNIKKESFFNSDQIHIIDSGNPEVDCNWIKEKSTFPADSFFSELELSAWLKSMINVEVA
jgi:hypothetical protein